MLSHGGKGQCGQKHADGRPGKACSVGKGDDQVQVEQEKGSVDADIDQAEGHSVFFGKIASVAGIFEQPPITADAFSVEQPAKEKAECKDAEEKKVGIEMIRMAEAVVNLIVPGNAPHRENAHGFIHKVKNKKTEDSKGQTAVIEVIALMPCLCAGKDGRNDKPKEDAEQKSQEDAFPGETELTELITAFLCIAEKKFTDERAEAGRKHADMEIAFVVQLFQVQVEERRQKARPHI